jgi:predicted AAA+ superfamily ATPase
MDRADFLYKIEQGFKTASIVALLGPRQCGKTTVARMYADLNKISEHAYFDLEDPLDLIRLDDSMLTLSELSGTVIIDEIQNIPELFACLRVLVDKPAKDKRYLILGSASRELIRQSSETLAGRIHYIEMTPFSWFETHDVQGLWQRGGFPLSYLAQNDNYSMQWRKDYIKTFLEQDIPNLGIKIPAQNLRRFWLMLAHYHGNILNASELGNSLDLAGATVKRYLDILVGTFMVRVLQPWHENIAKRQVKSPKIFVRDSGIYHTLLNIYNYEELMINPKLGASWEGFVLEEIIRHLQVDHGDCYFWATHNQAELDLLIIRGQQRLGFEIKHTRTPKLTRSMQIALDDLNLNEIIVIYAGDKTFRLSPKVRCMPLISFLSGDVL